MTATEVYDALRAIADSWALMAMFVCFAVLVWWPFRPGARSVNDHVANMIFEDEDGDPAIFGPTVFRGENHER